MLLKLTKFRWNEEPKPILIGTESIIAVERTTIEHHSVRGSAIVTKIQSRGAMVETNYVLETVEEIYDLYNNQL